MVSVARTSRLFRFGGLVLSSILFCPLPAAARGAVRTGHARAFADPARLVAELTGKNPEAMRRAAAVVRKTHDPRLLKPLLGLLHSKDPVVAGCAAEGLGTIGDRRAVPALMELIKDPSHNVRAKVVVALGRIRDARAVDPLVEALRDPDCRSEAAHALAAIGPDAAAPLIRAMGTAGDPAGDGATGALGRMGSGATAPLLELLGAEDSKVRSRAAKALGIGRDPAALAPLIEAYNSGRLATADAEWIAKFADPRVISVLVRALVADPDPKWDLRGELRSRGKAAAGALVAVIENPDLRRNSRLCDYVAELLGDLRDRRAIPGLLSMLREYWYNDRHIAATALVQIGDRSCIPDLQQMLTDPKVVDKRAAIHALRGFGADVVPVLIGQLQGDLLSRRAAAYQLGQLCERRAVPALVSLLSDGDNSIRKTAIEALGKIGDARAVEALSSALDDPAVCAAAGEALTMIRDRRAWERLDQALASENLPVVAAAFRYYVRLGRSGSEPVIARALEANGGVYMAEVLLNCGNQQLESAARTWAGKRGYRVQSGSISTKAERWGSH